MHNLYFIIFGDCALLASKRYVFSVLPYITFVTKYKLLDFFSLSISKWLEALIILNKNTHNYLKTWENH
jgi:hypothetical protein